MTALHVLIVDDDPALLQALPEALQLRMGDVTVDTADSAAAALARIAARDYNAIVTDIKMPGMDGLALLAEIRACRPDTPTLLITGHGEYALAIEALRGGACDFVQKPIDRDAFVASLRRALQVNQLSRQVQQRQVTLERRASELEHTVEERTHDLREADQVIQSSLRWLIAPSQQMATVVEQIKQVAVARFPILVEGEPGTGKGLVGRAIHELSPRRTRPFIAIDCGAISGPAIEAALFGLEEGVCSGEQQRTEGSLPFAGGGSVFLDEIGNLPLPAQSKLLYAWQERLDVRTIAASSVPLEPAVRVGQFREDVYSGLSEFVLTLPPLRERDDILHLANDFVAEASMEFGRPCREISGAAARVLLRHSWPGNVRELRNVIRRATLLASGVIEPEHLSLLDGSRGTARCADPASIGPSLRDIAEAAAADAERQAIRQALQASKGNKTEAARRLRTDYKTLHLKIKHHGLDASRFRNGRAS